MAAIALSKVRDDHIESLVRDALTPRFREEPIAPLLGGLLSEALRDDLHHGLVDLALEELHGWLVENPDTVAEVIGERAPWWAPPRLNEAVTGRIHTELVRWVQDIRDDPRHRARAALDSVLTQLSVDLLDGPRDPGPRRGAEGADPRQPGGDPVRDLTLGRAAPRADDLAPGPAGRRTPADDDSRSRRSRSGSAPTPACRRGWTGWPRTPRCSWSSGTAPR